MRTVADQRVSTVMSIAGGLSPGSSRQPATRQRWCCERDANSLNVFRHQPINRRRRHAFTLKKLSPQASTAYDVLFTSERPYYVYSGKESMLQRISVVKFAGDHDMADVAGATALCLDVTGSIHSLYREDNPLTGCYWDTSSLLPGLIPEGPIGILGLGAGTVPRVMQAFWPGAKMVGWELDSNILPVARQFMGLQQLEDTGALVSHVGDALAEDVTVPGGFAGLAVDLFADGHVLATLREVEAWRQLAKKLKPGGRIWANMADDQRVAEAIAQAFPEAQGHPSVNGNTKNFVALTGPLVEEAVWQTFPEQLQSYTTGWKPIEDLTWGG